MRRRNRRSHRPLRPWLVASNARRRLHLVRTPPDLEDFKKAGLPKTELVYPFLSSDLEEADGCALHFILSTPFEHLTMVHHMCRFDMKSKRLMSMPLSWPPEKKIANRLLGCEFFGYLDSQHLFPGGKKKARGSTEWS